MKEETNSLETKEILFLLLGLIAIFSVIFFLRDGSEEQISDENMKKVCGDGTSFGECSETKPYFCLEGKLIEDAESCGCNIDSNFSGSNCVSKYELQPLERSFNYTLLSAEKEISFTSYGDFAEYLSRMPRTIESSNGEVPTRRDFKLKILDNENQKELLMPLVVEIQNSQPDKVNQLRTAVSLVQNIPYSNSKILDPFSKGQFNYSRYPYEVLYYNSGICGEKSVLMAFILRELSYDVSVFYFAEENHEVVGVKCPLEKSFRETGYCFIETGGPAIISDFGIEYIGGIKLNSNPEIIRISEGLSLPEDMEEYDDAKLLNKIREGSWLIFNKAKKFDALKEKYGLAEEYNVA